VPFPSRGRPDEKEVKRKGESAELRSERKTGAEDASALCQRGARSLHMAQDCISVELRPLMGPLSIPQMIYD
jgi:hypothetical protein